MSSIIKSSFISFSNNIKQIEAISPDDVKIINNFNDNKEELEKDCVDNTKEIDDEIDLIENKLIEAEQKLKDAKKEAEIIINDARKKADLITKQAYEDGFEAGKKEAIKEQEIIKNNLENELRDEINKTINERNKLIDELEPKVAVIIKELVTNLIGTVETSDEIIKFLIRKGLEEIDLHNNFIVRVSTYDYDTVVESKSSIFGDLTKNINVEIINDKKLEKNDCIIETKYGNIDCGLKCRLEGLKNELELISKSFKKDF